MHSLTSMWNVAAVFNFIRLGMGFVLFWATIFVPVAKAQANFSCQELFEPAIFAQKPDRLYDFYQNEIQNLNDGQVQALNTEFLESLKRYQPPLNDHRAQALPDRWLPNLIQLVRKHPVIGMDHDAHYSQPGEEMGYCFGRAMYLHLLMLKMGIQKESIKKIWALGPMASETDGVTWGYHVALMVYTQSSGWMVLDPINFQAQTAAEWVNRFEARSQDHRIRFYATEPEKFGLYAGHYSRFILGLDLTISDDWFKHYFVDMLAATRQETLRSLGLVKITPEQGQSKNGPQPFTMMGFLKNIFRF